jgi:hypothetical protein
LETLAAKYGTALGGFKGNGGFHPALGADSGGFYPACGRSPVTCAVTLVFAGFAALGLVPEFLFVVELLFAGSKNKLRPTIHALQIPVLKFHLAPS